VSLNETPDPDARLTKVIQDLNRLRHVSITRGQDAAEAKPSVAAAPDDDDDQRHHHVARFLHTRHLLPLLCLCSPFHSLHLASLPDRDGHHSRAHERHGRGGGDQSLSELRLGIWSYCYTALNGDMVCSDTGHGYSLSIQNSVNNTVTIASSWTLGLAVHPVACGVSFIGLLLSFSQHITVTLLASLASLLAATLALIAFAIDIALYAYFKNQMGNLGFGGSSTITGPGFWLTFVAMILLFLAGFTVCCGRRRDRMASARTSAPSPKTNFFARFRRNR